MSASLFHFFSQIFTSVHEPASQNNELKAHDNENSNENNNNNNYHFPETINEQDEHISQCTIPEKDYGSNKSSRTMNFSNIQ